ncbi:hypothetical protein [Sphingopyxis sp. BSNA05]|uniref:hypothetical protein n=1 Tax=Sphingopyxis sp. BSNA05 TaxID=1236614 RepID=UPI0015679EEA|nr:hypothetical protein [Sphingopyxis sp. BSNA05]
MKVWEIGARTGIDGLRMAEREEPAAGAGELLVKVTASGLNYRDLMVLAGDYGSDLPKIVFPCPTASAWSKRSAKASPVSPSATGSQRRIF